MTSQHCCAQTHLKQHTQPILTPILPAKCQNDQSQSGFIKAVQPCQLIKQSSWKKCKWISSGKKESSAYSRSLDWWFSLEHLYYAKGSLTKRCYK